MQGLRVVILFVKTLTPCDLFCEKIQGLPFVILLVKKYTAYYL